MKTLHFSVHIQAPRERVWQLMLSPDSYRQWTAAFCEGSYYEGSWEQGQRIRFLGPGGEGGMYSEIAENRLYEFISIRHLGEIADGIDKAVDEKPSWNNARENYTFTSEGTATLLRVDTDTLPDFESFMTEAWPKALSLLKALCERDAARA